MLPATIFSNHGTTRLFDIHGTALSLLLLVNVVLLLPQPAEAGNSPTAMPAGKNKSTGTPAGETSEVQLLKAISTKGTGPDRKTAQYLSLCDLYIKQKRDQDLKALIEEWANEETRLAGGKDTPSMLPVLQAMLLKLRQAHLDESEFPLLARIYGIQSQFYGQQDARTLESMCALAKAQALARHYPEADTLFRDLVKWAPPAYKLKYTLEFAKFNEQNGHLQSAHALTEQILANKKSSPQAIPGQPDKNSAEQITPEQYYTCTELLQVRLTRGNDKAARTIAIIKAALAVTPPMHMSPAGAEAIVAEALPLAQYLGRHDQHHKSEPIFAALLPLCPRLAKDSPTKEQFLADYDAALRMQDKISDASKLEKQDGGNNYAIPLRAGATLSQSGRLALGSAILADLAAERLVLTTGDGEKIARVRLQLSEHLGRANRYTEATAVLRKALPPLRTKYWTTAPHTLIDPLTRLVIALYKSGKKAEAQTAYNDLLACCKQGGDPQDSETAKALWRVLQEQN